MELSKRILLKMKYLLKFVFAVDTIADRYPDDSDYQTSKSVKTHTQFSPSIYELYDGTELLQLEVMDFQTHLYELGELFKQKCFCMNVLFDKFQEQLIKTIDGFLFTKKKHF